MKKRDLLLSQISAHPGLLCCPLCRGALAAAGAALRCPAGHSFDVASSGYVNLLRRNLKADYGAELFEARRRVCAAGFFDALLEAIVSILRELGATGAARPVLLDAGCGEGSHLARVAGAFGATAAGVGVDISKEGVRIAAREHPGLVWLVGDLARLPLADNSVEAIMNILSPSNYAEFNRVLAPGGLCVKAVPGEGYLRELRHTLYGGREEHSNANVAALFSQSFQNVTKREIRADFPVTPGLWADIVHMSPLSWGGDEAAVRAALENAPASVTLDFLLLAGTKSEAGKGRA